MIEETSETPAHPLPVGSIVKFKHSGAFCYPTWSYENSIHYDGRDIYPVEPGTFWVIISARASDYRIEHEDKFWAGVVHGAVEPVSPLEQLAYYGEKE